MRPTPLPLLLLLAAPLSAQTAPPPPPAVPPQIAVETFGPDGWRTRLGMTNLGTMLESEQGKQLWQPYAEMMLGMWRELAGGEEPLAASKARVLAYGGRIRVALWIHPPRKFGGGSETTAVAAVLEPDGRSDLSAIAKDLGTAIERGIPGEWKTIADGAATHRCRGAGDTVVTEPFLVDGMVVCAMASGDDLTAALAYAHGLAATAPAPASPMAPALTIRVDIPALVAHLSGEANEDDQGLMRALGIPSLGNSMFQVTTAGPRVAVHFAQQFLDDQRGIFAGMFPDTQSVPTLLAARPPQGIWTVGHFDMQKIYDAILHGIAVEAHEDLDTIKADIHRECGIDPSADLLMHLTDEILVWAPPTPDAEDAPARTNWAIAFRTRDEAAFQKGLFDLLPKARPFLSRERSEKHGDVEVFRYGNMMGYDLWLGVGNGVFAICGGQDAEDRLGDLLDLCAKAPKELAADQTQPADFAPLKRFLPPGLHGYSVSDAMQVAQVAQVPFLIEEAFLGFYGGATLQGFGPAMSGEEAAEHREAIAKMLKEHQLDVTRSATGFAERTWHWRFYW